MRWIPDSTGRYPERPYFELDELEVECEGIVSAFLRSRYGQVVFPITTNDLVVLIEREASDVDLYADLSEEGDDVHGMTEFYRDRKPAIWIARELSEQGFRENRLRTTLTHELGHAIFHSPLLRFDQTNQLTLFGSEPSRSWPRCKRETIIGASQVDWLEWQAGYASGAFLMPHTVLARVVSDLIDKERFQRAIDPTDPAGIHLTVQVQRAFQVSADAARVRLLQRGYLRDLRGGQRILR